MPQICAFLARAEAWLAHGINDPGMAFGMEDLESHVRMAAAGVRGVAIPEPLFGYRKRPGSMSRAFEPHAMAYLYRRIRANSPDFFRRFGAELVGLYAENGHGALAPSVGEPSAAHIALFARDVPALEDVAHDLERRASRERLARALRARCTGERAAEWDYTTARLLLALDAEPAFARQLLSAAVAADPANGWFRLYAMVAELRDGRFRAAAALMVDAFGDFCRAEQAAVRWIAALEAVRGFPHVTAALGALFGDAFGLHLPRPPSHLPGREDGEAGDFADLHAALDRLRAAEARPGRADAAEEAVRAAAASRVSAEAVEASLRRWRTNWSAAALPATGVWGQGAGAYLAPARLPAAHAEEISERAGWTDALGRSREATGVVRLLRRTARTLQGG